MSSTTSNKLNNSDSEHGDSIVLESGQSPRSHIRRLREFKRSFKACSAAITSSEFSRSPQKVLDALSNGYVALNYQKSRRAIIIPNADFIELQEVLSDALAIAEKYFELIHQKDMESFDAIYKEYTENTRWVDSQGSKVLDVGADELSKAYAPGKTER